MGIGDLYKQAHVSTVVAVSPSRFSLDPVYKNYFVSRRFLEFQDTQLGNIHQTIPAFLLAGDINQHWVKTPATTETALSSYTVGITNGVIPHDGKTEIRIYQHSAALVVATVDPVIGDGLMYDSN